MEQIHITSAQYIADIISGQNVSIKATIEGKTVFVPLSQGNRHYAEIMRQVDEGTLTIQDAPE